MAILQKTVGKTRHYTLGCLGGRTRAGVPNPYNRNELPIP